MVFSSPSFLFVFAPLAIAVYLATPRRYRNIVLLAESILFYVWGAGAQVVLLVGSSMVDYCAGAIVDRGRRTDRKWMLSTGVMLSVGVNVSLLAYFKYSNFFVEQFNSLGFGEIAWTTVALPIGISFFTFQSMSYTLDLARGQVERLRNPLDFCLYVALFPQLIAGPIVRYRDISAELHERETRLEDIASGGVRFVHGLAKKVLIADSVAPIADAAFGAEDLGQTAALLGALAYTIQIYFDFSGYSDMAIGLGRIFGFRFPENFNRPYSSVSITDFWRRWHITLSSWFRDYLYIPLGGSRGSGRRTLINLGIVFLVTGIWHGANWTFIVWGIFHGSLLMIERLAGWRDVEPNVPFATARRAGVLIAVSIGWIVFRAPSVSLAVEYLGAFVAVPSLTEARLAMEMVSNRGAVALLIGVGSFALPGHLALGPRLADTATTGANVGRLALLGAALPYCILLTVSGTFSPFLYYQF